MMVHVAVCGNIDIDGGNAAGVLVQCARSAGIPEPAVLAFPSAFELLEHIGDTATDQIVDLIVLQSNQQGMSALQVVHDARNAGYEGGVPLIGESGSHASEAWRLHVDRYLTTPVSADGFAAEVTALLARISQLNAESAILHMRGGFQRIAFSRLVYAQTDNHNQVLHMRDSQATRLRCSSQDLFDKLAHDPRFLKLGSSYIVNLDYIRSMRDNGAKVIFEDGSAISVPVRFRKSAQNALLNHAKSDAPDIRKGA